MSTAAMVESQKGENLKLEVRRVIRAGRQRVFEAWTKPEEIRRWFGPGAIHVAEVEMDARVGGSYRWIFQGSIDGKPEESERRTSVEGVYTEVIPDELLSFIWRPAWNPGEESHVTVRLRDVEGGTEIVLTQERFAAAESRAGHERGWASCLDKLANYLDK